jgi:hypothetical protein
MKEVAEEAYQLFGMVGEERVDIDAMVKEDGDQVAWDP